MVGLLSIIKKAKRKERSMRILMVGLDNAGKTSIVKRALHEDVSQVSPTLGFNIKTVLYHEYSLHIWDIGGQKSLRPFWRNHFEETDALIWVVDSNDRQRLKDCKDELFSILLVERLAGASLLIFANKQDVPGAISADDLAKSLDLAALQSHSWHIQACSAISGDGVEAGFDWLISDIARRLYGTGTPTHSHSAIADKDSTVDPGDAVVATRRLPVTLLSGFLGAGKTTLLEQILTSPEHGLRIGVIVNDVGVLNIDAALIANHQVTQRNEEVIALQNGCICCTLRGDLLEEVAKLADQGSIDYLVIESSGVSEPMQVAEAFSEEFAEMYQAAADEVRETGEKTEKNEKLANMLAAGGLSTVSRLDTCVTVVDAVNFMSDFATADFLVDRYPKEQVPEEDDRNISDLQTDQIEFANVIIVNKCDLVQADEIAKVKAVIKSLNPEAKVLTSVKARVKIGEIIDTKLFSYEKAALGAGWLKSLREVVLPETEEYGIGTFVYRARRPFHPLRLWETIKDVFVVIQESYEADDEDGEDGDAMDTDENESDGGEGMEQEDKEEAQPQLNPKARLAAKQAHATWAPLLRAKGFIWLATRPNQFGELSQAGVMLTISGGEKFYCMLPEDEWPEDPAVREAIRKDFEGKWGDRRQEIVFIGQQMRDGGEKRIRAAMDSCLLDDAEYKLFCKAMKRKSPEEKLAKLFDDGFEDWMDDDHQHDDGQEDHGH